MNKDLQASYSLLVTFYYIITLWHQGTMATKSDAVCANCGCKASLKCTGCINSPEYHVGDSINVAYCGKNCQKDHWPTHKPRCVNMRRRGKLLRVAHLFRTVFLTYRECFFDVDLTSIDLRDGVLYLHQGVRPSTSRRHYGPFPSRVTTRVEHKEAALAIISARQLWPF